MDGYSIVLISKAIDAAFCRFIWFSCAWFLVYAIFGPWLKVKLIHLGHGKNLPSARRFGPVYISHILFSVLLVNPFIMLILALKFSDIVDSEILFTFLKVVYFWMLSLLLECLLLRVVGRWRILRWFQWRPPLRRVIPVSLALSTLAFGAGAAGIFIKNVTPSVLRSFPLRPKAFEWKVNTGVKPLFDGSLVAQSDDIIADDKYVYIQANAKEHQWQVVDRSSHKVLGDEAEALGYVLADDSVGTWQIKRGPGNLLFSRTFGKNLKTIPIVVDYNVIFLEHQVHGLIIGANPLRGILFALNPEKERVEWEVLAPAIKSIRDRRIGSISANDDIIAVGLWGSRIWAVDAVTGESLWEFDEDGAANAMYVVASEKAIVGFSPTDKAYAFAPRTGELKWAGQEGGLAGGKGSGNACLLGDKVIFRNSSSVGCVDIDTGEILWRHDFGDHYSGGVTCSDDGIVACASNRTLGLFEMDTGREIFRTNFPVRWGIEYGYNNTVQKAPGRIYAHPVFNDGQIYVLTNDGVLWALKPRL
jgi:outer membrane protein assembly factor BamB